MTVADLLPVLRELDPREMFLYLAAHAHELRLRDGQRLNDLTDFTTFFLELSQALKPESAARNLVPAQPRWHETCPRCGHVHQGEAECGEPMGGGRVCRCELEVPV